MQSRPLSRGDLVRIRASFTCLLDGKDLRLEKGSVLIFLEEFEHPESHTPFSACMTQLGECVQIPGVHSHQLGTKIEEGT